MRVLGMISGTSHDGIDVAVCDFRASGDGLVGRVEHTDSVPYSAELRAALVEALPPATTTLAAATRLDTLIGQEFAAAAEQALTVHRDGGHGPVDAVCSHGQTVYHWVEEGAVLGTLQLGQPAWMAERTGLPVVSDLRSADIAAGGQGAPLVCLLDRLVLDGLESDGPVAALNLGGIANLTVCAPGREPVAWDTGPANALVDAVVAADASTASSYDEGGRLAASGAVVPGLLDVLLADPYYALTPPKSTGKELYHLGHVHDAVRRWGREVALPDLVATLVRLSARTVADAVRGAGATRVLASGGGVRNPVLMSALAQELPGVEVGTTEAVGLDPDAKEAIAFALLGWATLHGVPGNVPSCTGAVGPRVLGRVTPGRDGVPRVDAVAPPTHLVLEGVAP